MTDPRPNNTQLLFRALTGAALAVACYLALHGCTLKAGYQRDLDDPSGDFDLDLTWEGGCLPDITPERPVQRITIYKAGQELRLVADAFCSQDRSQIVFFESLGANGCTLNLVDGDGGTFDIGDAAATDGGPEDAGLSLDICYCLVNDDWKVGPGEQTAFCEGHFKVVAETVDGLSATVEYGQDFYDPDDDDDLSYDSSGACGCSVVE
jgi:hypothetical protein